MAYRYYVEHCWDKSFAFSTKTSFVRILAPTDSTASALIHTIVDFSMIYFHL